MANSNGVDSELDQRIIRQVEYYFGDFNLPRDKFLQEQVKLDDGWILLSTMLNFKRLASLTTDQERIIEALKKSSAKLIEIDEEKKKIRRSQEKPIPVMNEARQKEVQSRTVYCKGFSKENSTLDKLLEYFGQYGSVENVQMRTYLDKATKEYIFKGSVFVVFSTKDLCDEFLKKESVEYEGVPLIVKKQEDYFTDKKKEREDKRKMIKAKLHQATNQQSGVKKSKDDDEENNSDTEEMEKSGSMFAKGAVVHIKDIPSDATWEDIKSAVETVWKAGAEGDDDDDVEVAYVDFHMGDKEGWIRLAEPDTADVLVQRAKSVEAAKGVKKLECKKDKNSSEESPEGLDSTKAEVKNKSEDGVDSTQEEEKKKSEDGVDNSTQAEVKIESEKVDSSDVKESDSENTEKVSDVEVKKEIDPMKDEPMNTDSSDVEKKSDEEVVKMEVCGALIEIRALKGSEEEAYLEKAQDAREKRFMYGGRARRGRRGGGRKGRGNRGGKRKQHWDSGPSNKRRR